MYYILSLLLLLMRWHNIHKANYTDSAQEQNTKYYTSNKQPQAKYMQKT